MSQATVMPAVSEPKAELLARLRRREPESLATVVQDHAKAFYRAARGLGFREEEAEDLVEDVFATFLETLDRFEGRSQVRTGLFGILHHKVMERRRDHYRDQQNEH